MRRIRGIAGRRRERGETAPGERRTDNYESHKSCIVYSPFPAVSRVSSVLPPFPDCLLLHAGVRACVRACPTCVVWISRRLEEERKKKRGKDTHVRGGVPLDVSAAVSFGLEKTVLGTKEKGELRSATAVGSQEKFLLKNAAPSGFNREYFNETFFSSFPFPDWQTDGKYVYPRCEYGRSLFHVRNKTKRIFFFHTDGSGGMFGGGAPPTTTAATGSVTPPDVKSETGSAAAAAAAVAAAADSAAAVAAAAAAGQHHTQQLYNSCSSPSAASLSHSAAAMSAAAAAAAAAAGPMQTPPSSPHAAAAAAAAASGQIERFG